MLDAVRKYVEAGREALTPKKAEELARALVKEGQARGEQVAGLARDLAEWSRRNSEKLLDTIRAEVKRQIARAGVATKDDIESLKRRIRKLEATGKASGKTSARKTTASRKTTAARKRTSSKT
jgi:polyhydroxyalkanoate synthesis regulator phasin